MTHQVSDGVRPACSCGSGSRTRSTALQMRTACGHRRSTYRGEHFGVLHAAPDLKDVSRKRGARIERTCHRAKSAVQHNARCHGAFKKKNFFFKMRPSSGYTVLTGSSSIALCFAFSRPLQALPPSHETLSVSFPQIARFYHLK